MTTPLAIIGMGRFGLCIANILSAEFEIAYVDRLERTQQFKRLSLQDLSDYKHVLLAVPINALQNVLLEIAPMLTPGTTVLDTASVKVLPTQWMIETLSEKINVISTHPIFGPDSYPANNTIVIHDARCPAPQFKQWQQRFHDLGLQPVLMTPQQHDQEVSVTQSITHYIGRLLDSLDLPNHEVATEGYRRLQQLQQQTCHDSIELFSDIMRYNPFNSEVLDQLAQAQQQLHRLLSTEESHNGQQ